MKLKVLAALFGVTLPVFAQYAGPAILSRGEAPSAMALPDTRFRPFVTVSGTYDSSLVGVTLDQQGQLENLDAFGARIAGGVSGSRSWRRTRLGLDYRGSVTHYFGNRYFDSTDHSMLFGVTHRLARHVTLALQATGGVFSRDFGLLGLSQTLPFDPVTTSIPTTDYFNNRTIYLSAGASLVFQKSARTSFSFGGGTNTTRRRSTALYGTTTTSAQGDVQYRLNRRSTIGATYSYGRFSFTRTQGGTDVHAVAGTFGMRLTRFVEFSGYAGVMRPETKFLQSVALDPVIQELLGVSTGTTVVHNISYTPQFGGRISRHFQNGVAFLTGARSVNPGNGLFLTSISTSMNAGYAYTGLRRWSFRTGASRSWSDSIGNVQGKYQTTSGIVSTSRILRYQIHLTMQYSLRQYKSDTFQNYNRVNHHGQIGLSWSPGELPLRIW